MPSHETSSFPRRALNLPFVTMLSCIFFSGMGMHTKLGPGPFRCPNKSCFAYSVALRRLLPFGELDTISQPPLEFAYSVVKYCVIFLCFPLHVRLPQVSVGRTSRSSPSRVHGCSLRLRSRWALPRGPRDFARGSLRASLPSPLASCACSTIVRGLRILFDKCLARN